MAESSRNSSRQRHGFYSLRARLNKATAERGAGWLASFGEVGEALREWQSELIADLGGDDVVSTQQRALVELATRTRLLLESVDRFLLEQPSLVNKSRRQLFPVVLQRQQLADALARYMATLGLERRRRGPDLSSYLARRSQGAMETPTARSDDSPA